MDWLTMKIQVIKLVRQATGWGLKESKNAVDNLFLKIRVSTETSVVT